MRNGAVALEQRAGDGWVVWRIRVDDPEQRISAPYESAGMGFLLAEESRAEMVEFAARLGCVYEGCRDDGSYGSDNDPCYTWWLRVPQAEHAQCAAQGWPQAVEECRQKLNDMFADTHYWEVMVDGPRTRALAAGKSMPALQWGGPCPGWQTRSVRLR